MQIVAFLQQNAHPRVAEKIPSVPENVTDQVGVCFAMTIEQSSTFFPLFFGLCSSSSIENPILCCIFFIQHIVDVANYCIYLMIDGTFFIL